MNSDTVRRKFVDYFVEHGHLHLPGLPLVPNDPSITTLFTIAGMQQMIPYFLGREQPPAQNMVTVQKTLRTVDIEEVGDLSHYTFFEMLGNFSVGGYFKHEAIDYTWDFLVNVLEIPAARWWAVTYPGDEEARDAWLAVGMPPERIGESEANWWGPAGPYGPCGPNSEIHFDRGIEFSCGRPDCRPETECCDRFLEIWNDVFMAFYQDEEGHRTDLPWRNIDTGMGFERLVTVVQGKESVYDTDLCRPIIDSVAALVGAPYGEDLGSDRSYRIVADHTRAITFLVSDGVMPSSEGRGYVLRRLLRRAALRGRLLGLDRPFLARPVEVQIELAGGFHTDLRRRRDHILEVVQQEERRFLHTLSRGLGIFEEMAERASGDAEIISGRDAFQLSDTYGFPLELTIELAQERGLMVDADGFHAARREAQELARRHTAERTLGASPETFSTLAQTIEPTVFTGYDELRTTTEVSAILAGGHPVARAEAGDEVEVILAETPFYAESGGQVGDTGFIRADSGLIRVSDTKRPYASFIAHRACVEDGSISVGDAVEADVDTERRLHILPHHSGTHLLHKALREVLGNEARQAGSLVAPDHLRFDFSWPRPLTDDELREVQDRVNAAIWANLPVRPHVVPYDEAIREGAVALFGEKYGDMVRVVSIGDWSKELCGGTHVEATGDIGLLVVTRETGSAAGVRRIEALAGAAAYSWVNDLRDRLSSAAQRLETPPENLLPRIEQLLQQNREQEKRLEALVARLARNEAESLISRGRPIGGFTVVAARIEADNVDYLQALTDAVKGRLRRGMVMLGADIKGRATLTMAVTPDLVAEGFKASEILRRAAKESGGGAGGKAEFAQGGAPDVSKIQDVLDAAMTLIERGAAR